MSAEDLKAWLFYYDFIVVMLAIAANSLVLIAVVRPRTNKQNIFYRSFLISLAVCDLFTATVNLTSMAYQRFASPEDFNLSFLKCGANLLRTLQLCGFFINLLNLSAMSVDNFLSVIMSDRVVRLTFASIWIGSFSLALLDIPISIVTYYYYGDLKSDLQPVDETSFSLFVLSLYQNSTQFRSVMSSKILESDDWSNDSVITTTSKPQRRPRSVASSSRNGSMKYLATLMSNEDDQADNKANICTFFSGKKMWFELCVLCLVAICFLILIICYSAVFKRVSNRFDASGRRARRLVFTTLIFIGAFTICWLPFMIFEFTTFLVFQSSESNMSDDVSNIPKLFVFQVIFSSIMITYQLLDPLIYAARVQSVNDFILDLVAECLPCCRPVVVQFRQSRALSIDAPALLTSRQQLSKTNSARSNNGDQQHSIATRTISNHQHNGNNNGLPGGADLQLKDKKPLDPSFSPQNVQ